MRRDDDKLTIIGEGSRRASLETLARDLGIVTQVDMPGHRNPLHDVFANADAFILSSDYEGLGVVVVEALAAGMPIVATDCCVNMAMLVDGAGVLVPIKNEAALAAAMDEVATLPVDQPSMRARAAQFAVELVAPRWLALFDSLKN